MRPAVSLRWLASRKKFTRKNLEQLEYWLDDDWEAKDVGQDVKRLLRTLANTMKGKL